MTDREKLIELIGQVQYLGGLELALADHLLANGVTFTPSIPGPSEADPNIMELCFHNGERHMKEKVCRELTRIAEHMPCITLAQAIQLLEGL